MPVPPSHPPGDPAADLARRLMDGFVRRTGVVGEAPPRRYLWTDAYAVGSLLGLGERGLALRVVDQVHQVLGRHRGDDRRRGWISGLAEEEGELHPTRGGLRIGKPLPERAPQEPADPRGEWDRDGQYLHYLTRWMHALHLTAQASGERRYLEWAVELARTAHHAFAVRPAADAPPSRLVWKMSIALDRPLVPSMGHHDPLDLLLSELELAAAKTEGGRHGETGEKRDPWPLEAEIAEMDALCRDGRWATEDPLGLGGLLSDAVRLARLHLRAGVRRPELLERLFDDAEVSLEVFHRSAALEAPPARRLPFRELGLATGLRAVESLAADLAATEAPAVRRVLGSEAAAAVARLLPFVPLADEVEATWSEPAARRGATWGEHEDINVVMLATALLPAGWLGELPASAAASPHP